MTDKKTYYVSVQSAAILEEQGAAAYEFEIEATDRDLRELEELFEQMDGDDKRSFWRAHTPFVQYHTDPPNDAYDENLCQVYQKLYDVGTQETKKHIESMGILQSGAAKK